MWGGGEEKKRFDRLGIETYINTVKFGGFILSLLFYYYLLKPPKRRAI
jgi:hypothetical protein